LGGWGEEGREDVFVGGEEFGVGCPGLAGGGDVLAGILLGCVGWLVFYRFGCNRNCDLFLEWRGSVVLIDGVVGW
jgi:hypothetical protein